VELYFTPHMTSLCAWGQFQNYKRRVQSKNFRDDASYQIRYNSVTLLQNDLELMSKEKVVV